VRREEKNVRLTIRKQVLTSLLFIMIGGTFAIAARNHPMGTAASMGRGFFPFWVGAILTAIGGLTLFRSQAAPDPKETPFTVDLKPLALIVLSVVAFAILLPITGLYATILATVLLASRADAGFSVLAAAILGLCLAVAAHLAFVIGLGLSIPLWPSILQI
jgi:hypothetical protein